MDSPAVGRFTARPVKAITSHREPQCLEGRSWEVGTVQRKSIFFVLPACLDWMQIFFFFTYLIVPLNTSANRCIISWNHYTFIQAAFSWIQQNTFFHLWSHVSWLSIDFVSFLTDDHEVWHRLLSNCLMPRSRKNSLIYSLCVFLLIYFICV